jgi:hypothetical protein
MAKLTEDEIKGLILNGIINPIYTNNGAREDRANEIRSYTIEPNYIFGVFVAVQNFKEYLFDFELTRKKEGDDWQLTYDYQVAKNNKLLYFHDDMKASTHRYYRESNTALDECGVLVRPALLMVEGTVTDSQGQRTNYTRELIDAIVESSNTYLESNEIKLFNDHEYSQESRIGCVTGKFSAREINELDISENGDRSVIGKYAIFNDGLEIRSEDAIEQYHSGLLKELSVGIDLKGSMFGKNVIYEVSAVPFPAVESAHIYSKGDKPMADTEISKYAFSFEAEIRKATKPSDEQIMAMEKTWDGFYAFSNVMNEIQNAAENELPKPRPKIAKKAIDDLSGYLMSIHSLKSESAPVPIVIMEKPMTEETATYSAAEFTAMQSEIAKLKKEAEDSRKFAMYQSRAIALRESGKLSPALYAEKFGNDGLATYQAFQQKDPLEAFLDGVEATAKVDARFAPSVYGATPLADQDVPERSETYAKNIKERAAAIPVNKVSY